MSDYEYSASDVDQYEKIIADLEREVERLKARLTYYERDTVRLRCYGCSKTVSTEVSDATLFRCVAYCPECIEAGKDQDPDALEAARAEGRREERERCCKAMCGMCATGKPIEHYKNGEWVHTLSEIQGYRRFRQCDAASIRSLDGEEGG